MKVKIKKTYIILSVLIFMLILGFSAKAMIKANCYDIIQPGMSYRQVVAIMGSEGIDPGTSLRVYWWYLEDGSQLQIYYDYEGPPLTADTIEKNDLEDHFVVTRVDLFKPQERLE